MSVYKRGNVWWYDFTYKGHRHRKATIQRTKVDAQKAEDAAKRQAELGTGARPTPTLHEAADKWCAARVTGKSSSVTTATRIRIMLRHMDPDMLVSAIDTPDVEAAMQSRRLDRIHDVGDFRHKSKKAPSNATVNRDMIDSTLRPILRYCKKVLKVRDMQEIDWSELRLAEPKNRVRAFSAAEMSDWADGLPAWHVPVRDFYARYGCRLREAFFSLDDLDISGGRVTLRKTKGGKERTVPLLEEDIRDLAARLSRARSAKLDTVWFRVMKNGSLRAIKPRGYQSASRTGLQRAKITDARPTHDLRHHAATDNLRATGNIRTVQRLLGHDSIASTARYAHADEGDVLKGLRYAADTKAREAEIKDNKNKASDAKVAGT